MHRGLSACDISIFSNFFLFPLPSLFTLKPHTETFARPSTIRWALVLHGMDNSMLSKGNEHRTSERPFGVFPSMGQTGKEKHQMTLSVARCQIPLQNQHEKLRLLICL